MLSSIEQPRSNNKFVGMHAREWVGPAVALRLLQELVENTDKNIRMMKFIDWHIVLLANPDGYEFSRQVS